MKFFKQATAPPETKRGQREDVHGSGVYPSSGPWPKGEAKLRAPEDWNRRGLNSSPEIEQNAEIKQKAKRARQGVRRRIKSDYDEGYSQGQVTEKSGPVEKAIRTG